MYIRPFLKSVAVSAGAMGFLALTSAGQFAQAAEKKLTFALPGVPPIFGSVFAMVARDTGLYKKYGLDVTLKPMNSGVGAARAVVSGNIDVSYSPTPPVARLPEPWLVPLGVERQTNVETRPHLTTARVEMHRIERHHRARRQVHTDFVREDRGVLTKLVGNPEIVVVGHAGGCVTAIQRLERVLGLL